MKKPRVILADDHNLLLDAFTQMLRPEFDVVGTATDGQTLFALALEHRPELVVLDISMPLLNGFDAGRKIKKSLPTTRLVYLTMHSDPELVDEAFRAGATGFLLKTSTGSELLTALHDVLRGRSYVTPLIDRNSTPNSDHAARDRITMRQREVLHLLAKGRSMKEVAFILDVSPRTVAFHKYRMMEDLQLKNNAELLQFAIKHYIV